MRMHDSLVASTQYKQAYALAVGLAQRAQSTWVYAKVKENLFPLAEPAYNTGGWASTGGGEGQLLQWCPEHRACRLRPPPPAAVVASPYYSRLVQHLQPLAGSA